jgi:hypothetical protein
MGRYAPVTDDELARARSDPAFRQKMLSQSLEALLEGIKKLRKTPGSPGQDERQIREGVELAVRLAELIQSPSQGTYQGPAKDLSAKDLPAKDLPAKDLSAKDLPTDLPAYLAKSARSA